MEGVVASSVHYRVAVISHEVESLEVSDCGTVPMHKIVEYQLDVLLDRWLHRSRLET